METPPSVAGKVFSENATHPTDLCAVPRFVPHRRTFIKILLQ